MMLQRRARRRFATALVAAALTVPAWPMPRAGAQVGDSRTGKFPEVGRVPMFGAAETTSPTYSGWLILNPTSRRGYQVIEVGPLASPRTIIHSFDLDTLQFRRRVELAGVPVLGAPGTAANVNTAVAAELVHGVDAEAHRIYLGLSYPQNTDQFPGQLIGGLGNPDSRRPLARLVAIDEDRLDAGRDDWAASFREPPGQERFHAYFLAGLTVTRDHVPQGRPGRLLALYAHPQPGANGALYDHTLVQWDPSGLTFNAAAPRETAPTSGLTIPGQLAVRQIAPASADPTKSAQPLAACRSASLAASGSIGQGGHQWGLLALPDAVWTGCQAADGAGAVTRVGLDSDGHLQPAASQDLYRLSQKVSDVLADRAGKRLLLRTHGGGHTWWSFDTGLRRFTGAVAGKVRDAYAGEVGLDPVTGRLYQLMQDYELFLGGRSVPFRGGFSYSDTRLDPPPPLEIARPDLAYPAGYAIRTDPVTRRVFVRLGHQTIKDTPKYPGTDAATPAPAEAFYRVLLDNVATTPPPAQSDDSAFTTDTPESSATKASYLGTGSGYGARTLLVGGLDAASSRNLAVQQSPCAKDDRELTSGAVRSVEVSDLSTAADAAGLDADARTRDDLASPVARCWPTTTPNGSSVPPPPAGADTDEFAFDEVESTDADKNGRRDRDGVNRYGTACTGDGPKGTATAPTGKKLSRHGFRAEADCAHSKGRADAEATGYLSSREVDALVKAASGAAAQVPSGQVQVGYAHSQVHVSREAGKGVTVVVDSIARDVVIPGIGTVGVVRGVATVTSTGRGGGARANYTRTVCDADLPGLTVSQCLTGDELDDRESQVNQALGSRGRIRFRDPDPGLYDGSPSGYKAGVQRPTLDLFEDAKIARDTSVALPAMELVLFAGDSGQGTGRQFVQLAGVQAGTSYGIACLYGTGPDGKCAGADDAFADVDDGGSGDGDGTTETVTVIEPGQTVRLPDRTVVHTKPLWQRILEAPVRVVQDALRLLFANPREFGLMAAVWALLYAPCYLGERRRSIAGLRARMAAARTA